MRGALVTAGLADVADLNPALVEKPGDHEEVSFLPMSAIDADQIEAVDSETRPFSEVSKGYTPFQPYDVLVAKITPCFENGKIALAKPTRRVGFGSTEFHVIRAHSGSLDPRYLVHFMRQGRIRLDGQRKMTGSAGQRRVPEHFLAGLQIPLPPLSEQRRIAEILDRADALRAKRRTSLSKRDTLTESIFVDMFGDPATNPKGWSRQPVGSLASKFSDGPFGSDLKSAHYTNDGVRVVRLQNIGVGEFIDENKAYVSEAHFATLKKHECLPGDVLVGTLGEPNLRACIQPDWLLRALNKADCVQLRPNQRVAHAEYLCALLNCPSTERMAQGLVLGQTRSRISMGRLRGLLVPRPPIELQAEFGRVVASARAVDQGFGASAAALEALFESLQHRAFRGRL